MDWKDIGDILRSVAPTLGTILGGPLGGAAGTILANTLGTEPTPEAVGKAIEQGGAQVTTAIAEAEATAAARWNFMSEAVKADAAQSQTINETIRAEVAAGQKWWAWRNLWGYSCVFEISGTSLLILWELATGDLKAINAFVTLSGFFLSWYGMRIGVLGYIYRGASNEKIAAVTGEVPGLIGNLIKAVTKR